jgi:hypothetical protein
VKEGAIPLEREAQILGGYAITSIPLFLELGTFLGEDFCQTLHGRGDETIRLFDGTARLVNEGGLNCIPPAAQIVKFVIRE